MIRCQAGVLSAAMIRAADGLRDGRHFVEAEHQVFQIQHRCPRRLSPVPARDSIIPPVGHFRVLDEPGFAQVLRDVERRDTQVLGEIVYRQGLIQESPDNAETAYNASATYSAAHSNCPVLLQFGVGSFGGIALTADRHVRHRGGDSRSWLEA